MEIHLAGLFFCAAFYMGMKSTEFTYIVTFLVLSLYALIEYLLLNP